MQSNLNIWFPETSARVMITSWSHKAKPVALRKGRFVNAISLLLLPLVLNPFQGEPSISKDMVRLSLANC